MTSPRQSHIYVLAGVNGAGKSSIAGAAFREMGGDYYNPDEAARGLMAADPALSQVLANIAAWGEGVRLLRRAIDERLDYAFETTLGANTIPRLLAEAASRGVQIYVWYVGLSSPQLHIDRVQARVRRGGHDIPTEHIHRRYEHSRLNLIELLPGLTGLRVYDNSVEADPAAGKAPHPMLVLHMERGKILNPLNLKRTPTWAKPIVAAALKLDAG
ncbi:MAG TPA: zeta toxin family protein [Blastocatellia bacterium]|jgi:predicted ABC-type ATPase|nr:zeta toxin family protein [Blastocatellia bacterium]